MPCSTLVLREFDSCFQTAMCQNSFLEAAEPNMLLLSQKLPSSAMDYL